MNIHTLQKIASKLCVFSLQDIRIVEPDFGLTNITYRKKKGYIKQITRGRYIYTDVRIDEGLLYSAAHKIYTPCYISMESALRYYNLIPEGVFTTTACATKKTQKLTGDIGTFYFYHIKPSLYRGYTLMRQAHYIYMMANPAKTICDFFYLKPHITSNDFEELRRDCDELSSICTPDELRRCAVYYDHRRLLSIIDDFILFWQS